MRAPARRHAPVAQQARADEGRAVDKALLVARSQAGPAGLQVIAPVPAGGAVAGTRQGVSRLNPFDRWRGGWHWPYRQRRVTSVLWASMESVSNLVCSVHAIAALMHPYLVRSAAAGAEPCVVAVPGPNLLVALREAPEPYARANLVGKAPTYLAADQTVSLLPQ